MGIYLGATELGGGDAGGGGLLNELQFKSSGTFNPANPYGDGTREVTQGALVHFFLVQGGQAGSKVAYGAQQFGGRGGQILSKSIPLDSLSSISIVVGAGGVASNATMPVGAHSTAIQSGGISLSSGDADFFHGGYPAIGYSSSSNSYWIGNSATQGLYGFSQGGAFSAIGFGVGSQRRGANTGDGGEGSPATSVAHGRSGIVIIKW